MCQMWPQYLQKKLLRQVVSSDRAPERVGSHQGLLSREAALHRDAGKCVPGRIDGQSLASRTHRRLFGDRSKSPFDISLVFGQSSTR